MNKTIGTLEKTSVMVAAIMMFCLFGKDLNAQPDQATPNVSVKIFRLRGTIESVQNDEMVLKGRDGETLYVNFPEDIRVQEMYPIEFTTLKPGAIVGSTALPQKDGSLQALEIHMFPEGSGGPPEGQRVSDLQKDSLLTNGHVLSLVPEIHKRQVKLSSSEEEITILVPDNTPIVGYRPGDPGLLVPGAKVYLHAVKTGENIYKATSATVGADGMMPPL